MEFKDYVRVVRAHWVGVLVLAVAGVVGAIGYDATQPQVYQASATGYVTAGSSDNTSDATLADQLAKAKVTSYVAVATSSKVADRVIKSLDLHTSAGALIGDISVSQPTCVTSVSLLRKHRMLPDAFCAAWLLISEKLKGPGQFSTRTRASASNSRR